MHEAHLHLNVSPTRVSQIREETGKDTTLSALREIIMHGWPKKRTDCPAYLHAYWNYRDELTVADGLILKGTRIVILESLQCDVDIPVAKLVTDSGSRHGIHLPPFRSSFVAMDLLTSHPVPCTLSPMVLARGPCKL